MAILAKPFRTWHSIVRKLHGWELDPVVGFDQVSPAELGVAVEVPASTGDNLIIVVTHGNVPKSHRERSQLEFRFFLKTDYH